MVKEEISVVIADDHPMLLKGLYDELMLNKYQVVGQAKDGIQALELILTKDPMVAILDVDMPLLTGFEVIRICVEKGVGTKFIIISFHREQEYIAQAKALNIDGYLLKEDSFSEIQRCITDVLDGKTCFSSSFDNVLLDHAHKKLKRMQMLTSSEITILKLIANQMSTNLIADKLGVSVRTIEKHRSNIIVKLMLEGGTNALTNWALTNKKVIREL